MRILRKSLILGSLIAASAFGYKSCNRKPDFINLSKDGSVAIDYAKTTNFSFENREELTRNIYARALSALTPQQQMFGALFGSHREMVLKDEIQGRWCSQNKCFLVRARDVEISDKFNSKDDKLSAFIIPESEDNGRKWNFYVVVDYPPGQVRSPASSNPRSEYYPNWKKLGKGLFYARINEPYDKLLPLTIFEKSVKGEIGGISRFVQLDNFGEADFNKDFISKEDYDEQQRMKNPVYAREKNEVHNLFEIRRAINAYGRENGNVRPPRLEDLVPKYIGEIPEGRWDYDPSRSLEIKKD